MSCARNGHETALDITAYTAQIAAQLGAHIIKVKPPCAHIEQPAAQKVYQQYAIQRAPLADRVAHVVQIAFAGHRIVIFSRGARKEDDQAIFEEIRRSATAGDLARSSAATRSSAARQRR